MNNKRIITLGFFLVLAWGAMVVKIFNIQVMQRNHFATLAQKQSVRRNIIPPKRGEIFDREKHQLVMNASIDLEFTDGKRAKTRQLKRVAPHGRLAGQVLGNIGRDGYGQLGLEYHQDKVLRGVDGWKYARYDVARRYHPEVKEEKKPPIDGQSIVTTLDIGFQKIVEQALEKGVKKVGALGGTAIVVHPPSGDVLAMASYPFYNPNRRSREDIKGWRNSAISKTYEPGSTFKIFTSATVLEEEVAAPQDTFDGENGKYQLSSSVLVHDTKAMERLSLTQALTYSSNIVMVKTASKLKPRVFYQYIRSFGFGMKTGISLPAEESGRMKPVNRWSSRTQATLAWGQEIAATPLQVTMAAAAIANDGILMKPRIIKAHLGSDGTTLQEFPPRKVRRVVSRKTAATLREMLATVVEEGTAKRIRTPRYSICGKTGTVEKIDKETGTYMKGKFHSSFVGMVPAQQPELVCLVLVNEPQKDKYGGACAAPVFREIMDRILSIPGSQLAVAVNGGKAPRKSEAATQLSFAQRLMGTLRGMSSPATQEGNTQQAESAPGETATYAASLGTTTGMFDSHPKRGHAQGSQVRPGSGSPQIGNRTEPASPGPVATGEAGRMPDVRFLSLRDALHELGELDVVITYRGVGKVVQQEPLAGSNIKRGGTCVLYLGWKS